MAEMTQGTVTVTLPEGVEIPEKAGTLSPMQMLRVPKARQGVGAVCAATADAMAKNPDRLVPFNVDVDHLARIGRAAEQFDTILVDMDAAFNRLKQADTLMGAEAHEALRRVLAFVRSQEKFDPRITDLVPHLIEYFSHSRSSQPVSSAAGE